MEKNKIGYDIVDIFKPQWDNYTVRDFNITNNRQYKYMLQSIENQTPIMSASYVTTPGRCWSIIELLPTDLSNYNNASIKKKYTVDENNSWLFKYNGDFGSQTQNISKSEQQTLGRYSRVGRGLKNNITGSITALLGQDIIPGTREDGKHGYYEKLRGSSISSNDPIDLLNLWRSFVVSNNPKLLKDVKGQKWIVQVMSGQNTPMSHVEGQPDTISFSWTEIENTDNVIITKTTEIPATIYTISSSITNGSYNGSSSIGEHSIVQGRIIANTGCELPTSITVTGCECNDYNSTTGTFTLSHPISNVTIAATCVRTSFNIGFNYDDAHYTIEQIGGTTPPIRADESTTYRMIANNVAGYEVAHSSSNMFNITGGEIGTYSYTAGGSSVTFTVWRPTDNIVVNVIDTQMQTVTINATHCTVTGPAYLGTFDASYATYNIVPASGAVLPTTAPTVTGVNRIYSYDSETGELELQKATGPVTITAHCLQTYTITINITNGTSSGATTIIEGGTAGTTVSANSGYTLPDAISVTNASYSYHKNNGAILLSNPTGNVIITVTCPLSPSGYTVRVTNDDAGWNAYNALVFDGSDATATQVATVLPGSYADVTISSGYMYIVSDYGIGGGIDCSAHTSDSIAIVSYPSSGSLLFSVSGNGSVTVSAYSCYIEGTPITLSDGSYKNVEDITYDDRLLVWDFDNGQFSSAKPLWLQKAKQALEYNHLVFSDGSELNTINQHRIFNKEAGKFTYPMTDDTPIGTTTLNDKGEFVILISKEVIQTEVTYYNIITDYHINCFAGHILTSCRMSNIYPIVDMKYVKEDRPIIQYNVPEKWYKGLRLAEQPAWSVTSTNAYDFGDHSYEDYVNRLIKDSK